MFRPILKVAELWEGEMRRVLVDERPVLLLKVDGEVRAYADRCAHLGLPLSQGTLCKGVLTCKAHQYTYRASDGQGINPACAQLEPFAVRVDDGMIAVDATGAGR